MLCGRYTEPMKWPVKAVTALPARTKDSQTIARFYAVLLIALAIMQLLTFDRFPALISSFWLPGGQQFASFLAAFIVICELFAVPFLLRLKMSQGARVVSMVFGWVVPSVWLGIAIWLQITINDVSNVGFLGATIPVAPGWWAALVSVALGVLAAWASWGQWPARKVLK